MITHPVQGVISSQGFPPVPSVVGFFKRNVGISQSGGELISWTDPTSGLVLPNYSGTSGFSDGPMAVDGTGSPYNRHETYDCGINIMGIWSDNMRCAVSYTHNPSDNLGTFVTPDDDSGYFGKFSDGSGSSPVGAVAPTYTLTFGQSPTNYGSASGVTRDTLHDITVASNTFVLATQSWESAKRNSRNVMFYGTTKHTTWAVAVHAMLFYTDAADDALARVLVGAYKP